MVIVPSRKFIYLKICVANFAEKPPLRRIIFFQLLYIWTKYFCYTLMQKIMVRFSILSESKLGNGCLGVNIYVIPEKNLEIYLFYLILVVLEEIVKIYVKESISSAILDRTTKVNMFGFCHIYIRHSIRYYFWFDEKRVFFRFCIIRLLPRPICDFERTYFTTELLKGLDKKKINKIGVFKSSYCN